MMSHKEYENIGDPITKLIEECSEVIHILCKIKRFGYNNFNPDDKNKTPNHRLLELEMFDLNTAYGGVLNDILYASNDDKLSSSYPADDKHIKNQ